jgi:hypothetical protein
MKRKIKPICCAEDFFRIQRAIRATIYRAEHTERAVIIAALGTKMVKGRTVGFEVLENHDRSTEELKKSYNNLCRLFESQYEPLLSHVNKRLRNDISENALEED